MARQNNLKKYFKLIPVEWKYECKTCGKVLRGDKAMIHLWEHREKNFTTRLLKQKI
jgi:hypothetical protein